LVAALPWPAWPPAGLPRGRSSTALGARVLGRCAGELGARGCPRRAPLSTRLIDLGPASTPAPHGRARGDDSWPPGIAPARLRGGWNATVSVWKCHGSALKSERQADASDFGDMIPRSRRTGARRGAPQSPGGVRGGLRQRRDRARPRRRPRNAARTRGGDRAAVLEMDRFFRHSTTPPSPVPTSRCRGRRGSALQIDRRSRRRASEPSNPCSRCRHVVHARVLPRRCGAPSPDDGVFCQWVQLYQLPYPSCTASFGTFERFPSRTAVVRTARRRDGARFRPDHCATIVRGSRASSGPGGALRCWARDTCVDQPEDYFGHSCSAKRCRRLLERPPSCTGTIVRLEFLAAPPLIDRRGTEACSTSLADIGRRRNASTARRRYASRGPCPAPGIPRPALSRRRARLQPENRSDRLHRAIMLGSGIRRSWIRRWPAYCGGGVSRRALR